MKEGSESGVRERKERLVAETLGLYKRGKRLGGSLGEQTKMREKEEGGWVGGFISHAFF